MKAIPVLVLIGLTSVAVGQNPYPTGCYSFTLTEVDCTDYETGNCQGHLNVYDDIKGAGLQDLTTANVNCTSCASCAGCKDLGPALVPENNPLCQTGGGGGGGEGGGGSCTSCTCGDSSRRGNPATEPNCQPCCPSPIVVDTTGHGFHLTSPEKGVMFDIRADGHPVQVAWTDPHSGNAFLALDRNHDGIIDSGLELFGNFTEQPASDQKNGYRALAEFDKPENGGNGDGVIDWRDAVFPSLVLWIDANHDGVSQPNELHPLPELGVYSIGLKYIDEPEVDQYGNGFRYRGILNPNPIDGESKDGRWTYDVFLRIDPINTGSSPNGAGACGLSFPALQALRERFTRMQAEMWARRKIKSTDKIEMADRQLKQE